MEGHAATIRSRATRSQPAARFAHAGACAIDRSPRRGTGNSAGDRRKGRKVCCCVDASAGAMIYSRAGPSVSCRPCTARREPDGGTGWKGEAGDGNEARCVLANKGGSIRQHQCGCALDVSLWRQIYILLVILHSDFIYIPSSCKLHSV